MIAIDANLLVYAHVTSYPQHEAARTWLEDQLVRAPRVALPWVSLFAFVRLVTNPRLFTERLPGQPGLRANDVPDAHLAALAVEHGLRLATSDSGFARFSGLQWFNPLQAA